MPHIIVKLWPGESERQERNLAAEITKVSVAMEEVKAADWTEKVYKPNILAKHDTLYKEPGYRP